MTMDLTFITNEQGQSLEKRFSELITHSDYFDCLVGYFYASGFHAIYKSLEDAKKIRILIGMSTNKKTYGFIQESKKKNQGKLLVSHKEVKDEVSSQVTQEMDTSEDAYEIEKGIRVFIDWLKSGKLEIRVYPTDNIHAKLYIMTFKKGQMDIGRVITGSSNFTQSGLRDNIEFNVELKNNTDYEFSLQKFNELWEHGIDVSEKYVETMNEKTWIKEDISPYELYLKFLYEYLKDKINLDMDEISSEYRPKGFMDLEYQKDAVRDAKMKLEEYGGVFVSDVVGLGKTYISAMLANELEGRSVVIAPPRTLDKDNPGSWPNIFSDFGVRQTDFESIGMIDKLLSRGVDKYSNIFIDEAHRFRTETTQMYETLFNICRGKRVILVTATPLNNTPMDILSQIKLFQNAHQSTLPNPEVRNLERYFKRLQRRLNGLDRVEDKEEYLRVVKENAEDIRKNVLRYLMVRRTRSSIVQFYNKDLQLQGLKFPEVEDPTPVVYHFDEELDKIFTKTLKMIINDFKYARYMPLLKLKEGLDQLGVASQKNMGRFMKILLLKRLESSFFAFKQSINRFIYSYQRFIEAYQQGRVFTSQKHMNKILDLLENDDEESIQQLIDEEKAVEYSSDQFEPELLDDLNHDLELLEEIQEMWKDITRDPKIERFMKELSTKSVLKKHKLIIFTESKETADYLETKLSKKYGNSVMSFSSKSFDQARTKIIENYDANLEKEKQKDDIRILITTDILSEGVNLHRSNVVINYDIPWNPVKMMQRVGRVNRVSRDPPFDMIHTYNFFPAGPINENIGLAEAAESKIKAFIEMLGNDAPLLTEEEIKSHDLFTKLTTKKMITGEDEEEDVELKYITMLRDIRDNDTSLFTKIKRLPKKARTAKKYELDANSVVSFFRKGKLRKIYHNSESSIREVDFEEAAEILESKPSLKRQTLPKDFYQFLSENKTEFKKVFVGETEEISSPGGRSTEAKLIKYIKAVLKAPQITDDDEDYLYEIMNIIKKGGVAKATVKRVFKSVKDETDPLKILGRIKGGIPQNVFEGTSTRGAANISGPKEVILSEYLIGRE
ncbi:MAG: Helicase [Promethearchaeota archaeon]|nr:MAG: Helicase [Candidatus Lokiarchaeota archaeon]